MLSKDEVASLPTGTPLWLVGTRDPEGSAPWKTAVDAKTPRFLTHGEWAAFRTEREAQLWHAENLAEWARAEARRLTAVALAAEKRAKALMVGVGG